MWANEHSVVTSVSKEKIWDVWSDVEHWNQWDTELEWCKLDGKWQVGTTYTLKPKGGPKAKAVIESCEYLKGFSDTTNLPFAKLRFIHTMSDVAGGTKLTHRVEISGLLGFVFVQVIGKKTIQGLPLAMNNLIALAKQK